VTPEIYKKDVKNYEESNENMIRGGFTVMGNG
jgi:hypothetical protein